MLMERACPRRSTHEKKRGGIVIQAPGNSIRCGWDSRAPRAVSHCAPSTRGFPVHPVESTLTIVSPVRR